ncbi:MAG: bifunctional anthranilate synthase component I family protein/class IV aminotransferase [Magnetococcales bacterium]|nr:bifunctional anthranilate synthase component I family protein/class IV aminotransferase [Magnetococcales bacterium]
MALTDSTSIPNRPSPHAESSDPEASAAYDRPLNIWPAQLRGGVRFLVDFAELGRPFFFQDPQATLVAWHPDEVQPVLRAAEKAAHAGAWVGGFLTYEAAAAFALPVHAPEPDLPLAWFAVFDRALEVTLSPLDGGCWIGNPVPQVQRDRFQQDLNAIQAWILSGDTYQVNYTLPARIPGVEDLAALFLRVHLTHRHPYATWLHLPGDNGRPEWSVASFSPELFLRRHQGVLISAPIKGTRPRSRSALVDARRIRALQTSIKDRAEHVMIVDMVRNDLGRISRTGSVAVPHLFEWRTFSSVHHLETRISGEPAPATLDAASIMAAMFPAASITGAPKHRTMEIIRTLEKRPRGIYTGAVGLFQPGGDFLFNVAIRTVVQRGHTPPLMGLGGGVVADSNPAAEWSEMADKGHFLAVGADPPPGLLETMRVDATGNIPQLGQHLTRLEISARALGMPLPLQAVTKTLQREAALLHRAGLVPRVLRLELHGNGAIKTSHRRLTPTPATLQVQLAAHRVDRLDRLNQHKTTRREHLTIALRQARWGGYDDALFLNNLGGVTEGSIRGILARLEGRWYAPPVSDGLLPSLWRAAEMEKLAACEQSLTLEMLCQAEAIRMGNAVQGGQPVAHLTDPTGRTLWRWREKARG